MTPPDCLRSFYLSRPGTARTLLLGGFNAGARGRTAQLSVAWVWRLAVQQGCCSYSSVKWQRRKITIFTAEIAETAEFICHGSL